MQRYPQQSRRLARPGRRRQSIRWSVRSCPRRPRDFCVGNQQYDPLLRRITVTDIRGAVVAATHKTIDYAQADEEYWQNIYADGRGAVSITDILYDDVTKASDIGIGMPILEEGTNQVVGTLDALVDVSTIFPILRQAQFGPSGRVMLVKSDGTVIAAPAVSTTAKLKSDEYAAVQDALGTVSGRNRGTSWQASRRAAKSSASLTLASKTITRSSTGWCSHHRTRARHLPRSAARTRSWRSCLCWALRASCCSASMCICIASRRTPILRT